MTLLTDDLIEKGARALFESQFKNPPCWDQDASILTKDNYRNHTRACLQAILPDVVQACAKVASDRRDQCWEENDFDGEFVARHIATAISSLVSQEKDGK